MTAYLAQRIDTTPQMQRVLGATPSNLGRQIGGSASYLSNAFGGYTNTTCYFAGALFRLCRGTIALGGGVWRSVDGGETQTLMLSTNAVNLSGFPDATGPYVVYGSDGVPRLTILAGNAGGGMDAYSSLTGLAGSWATIAVGDRAVGFPVIYRGALVWYGGSSLIYTYTPSAASVASISSGGMGAAQPYLIVWNDVLYAIGGTSITAGAITLYSIVGGAVQTLLVINTNWGPAAAVVDPATNNLVVVMRDNTTNAWKAFEILSTLAAPTDVTTNVIGTGALSAFTSLARFVAVYYDQDSNPGGPPQISFMVASSNVVSSPVSQFRFNGVGAGQILGVMPGGAANDSGGAVEFSWADKNIGGQQFFTPTQVGLNGTPVIENTGKGVLGVGVSRRKFKLRAPRSQILTTLVGAGTYDLFTAAPFANLPVGSGYTTIRGVIGGFVHTASDLVTAGVLAAPATTTTAVQALPAAVINVTSTGIGSPFGPSPAFPLVGTIVVDTGTPQTIAYTGLTATSFTGCIGGAGNTSIGGYVRGGLLPAPGTIDVATGVLTGTTGTLDAARVVEALYVGGTASEQWYRAAATNEYPENTALAPLTLPTSGSIDIPGTTNTGCNAAGTEQQVSVGMSGFTAGERVSFEPRALT